MREENNLSMVGFCLKFPDLIDWHKNLWGRKNMSEEKCLTEKWCLQLYVWHYLMRKDLTLKCRNFSAWLQYGQRAESHCVICWNDWELATQLLRVVWPAASAAFSSDVPKTNLSHEVRALHVLVSSGLVFVSSSMSSWAKNSRSPKCL